MGNNLGKNPEKHPKAKNMSYPINTPIYPIKTIAYKILFRETMFGLQSTTLFSMREKTLFTNIALEHLHWELQFYSILPSQKATLSLIPYHFTIPPTSQNSIILLFY